MTTFSERAADIMVHCGSGAFQDPELRERVLRHLDCACADAEIRLLKDPRQAQERLDELAVEGEAHEKGKELRRIIRDKKPVIYMKTEIGWVSVYPESAWWLLWQPGIEIKAEYFESPNMLFLGG